jgi:hypothetical protein
VQRVRVLGGLEDRHGLMGQGQGGRRVVASGPQPRLRPASMARGDPTVGENWSGPRVWELSPS